MSAPIRRMRPYGADRVPAPFDERKPATKRNRRRGRLACIEGADDAGACDCESCIPPIVDRDFEDWADDMLCPEYREHPAFVAAA